MKHLSIIILLSLSFVLSSCNSDDASENPEVITQSQLEEHIESKDLTLVFFYTSWCGASSYMYEEFVLPYHKSIQEHNANAQIIMIAGDDAVTKEKVREIENEGILSYRLNNAGTLPPKNRYKIRKFTEKAFPNQEVESIQGFSFGIPATLLINKKGEILNTKEATDFYGILRDYIESSN